jgi:hypothetical protein
MNTTTVLDWWNELATSQQVFWTIAIVASVLFVIVFIISLFGFDTDSDIDADMDVDGHADFHVDADFSAFSFRSIVAFFTFFGWTGVLLLNNGMSAVTATIGAFVSGFMALFLVAYMLFKFSNLEESGTTDVHMTLLQEGEVYLTIPQNASGMGIVQVKVQGALKEWNAKTEGGTLKTGSKIKVIDVLEDDVLLVKEIPLLN